MPEYYTTHFSALDAAIQVKHIDGSVTITPLKMPNSVTITPDTPGWENDPIWQERVYVGGQSARFTCQREMLRDYTREAELNDGFEYWRTTGRLVVTWFNDSVTYIAYKEPKHSPVVLDCGYDESAPF